MIKWKFKIIVFWTVSNFWKMNLKFWTNGSTILWPGHLIVFKMTCLKFIKFQYKKNWSNQTANLHLSNFFSVFFHFPTNGQDFKTEKKTTIKEQKKKKNFNLFYCQKKEWSFVVRNSFDDDCATMNRTRYNLLNKKIQVQLD